MRKTYFASRDKQSRFARISRFVAKRSFQRRRARLAWRRRASNLAAQMTGKQ